MCLAYVGVGGAGAVLGVPVGSLSPTSTKNVCVCVYISRTFVLQLANRVSWFCCCVWSEKCVKKMACALRMLVWVALAPY